MMVHYVMWREAMNLDGVEINVMGHNMIICYGMVWSKLELNGTQ